MSNQKENPKPQRTIPPRQVLKADVPSQAELERIGAGLATPVIPEDPDEAAAKKKFSPGDAVAPKPHAPDTDESATDEYLAELPWEREAAAAIPGDPDATRSDEFVPMLSAAAQRPVPAFAAILIMLAVAAIAFFLGRGTGIPAGRKELLREQTRKDQSIAPAAMQEIDAALTDLQGGNPAKAATAFQDLGVRFPGIASLHYLAALSAMRAGDPALSKAMAEESIRRGERVSDSLALAALLEAQVGETPDRQKFADSRLRAEFLLQQSAMTDTANPLPLIELASISRRQGKSEEAIKYLKQAALRAQRVDAAPFIRASIALAELQAMLDSDLPDLKPADGESSLRAAYVALRKGRMDEARAWLLLARSQMDPELFRYLTRDQAFRAYAGEKEVREFLR